MKRTSISMGLLALIASSSAIEFREIKGEMEFTGELIVRPKNRSMAAVSLLQGQIKEVFEDVGEYVVRIPKGSNESRYATQLLATGQFDYAEPNWRVFATYTPSDPNFGVQWHHSMIQSSLAWDISRGNPNLVIAVVDTGVDIAHPDLAAHVVPGYNGVTRLPQSLGGIVTDSGSHGTHVSGCAAQISNSIFGLGPANQCRIMPIRISDNGSSASSANINAGARWAVENGAKVINISFSGFNSASAEATGAYIRSLGGLLFYAAGNSGANIATDQPSIVVVGNSTSADISSTSSVRGLSIDIFSPGSSIWATTPNNGWQAFSGTSMASPVAAGVAALVFSVNPGLTPAQAEKVLSMSAQDWGNDGNDALWGYGRINANRAVRLAKRGTMAYDPATLRYYEVVDANLHHHYAVDAADDRSFAGLTGRIASVETVNVQNFLMSKFANFTNLRVGGFQAPGSVEPAGGWSWVGGGAFGYTNWIAGEPDTADNSLVWNANGAGGWADLGDFSNSVNGFLVQYQSSLVNHVANINLGDFDADSSVPVLAELFVDGQLVHTSNATGGTVSVPTGLRGPVQIRFTASHWLDKVVSLTLGATPSTVSVTMVNGDVDSDNEIGAADLSLLSGAFLSAPGDANYLAGADLDGDGEVGSSDMSILSRNFLQVGDQL